MGSIPESHLDLLTGKAVANLAVMAPDGYPLVTPTWIDSDGENVLVNSMDTRLKVRFMRERPEVGVCVFDPENTSRYLSIVGDVVEMTKDGAVEHVHELAGRYRGVEEYPYLEQDEGDRILITIEPHKTFTSSYEQQSTESGFSRSLDE